MFNTSPLENNWMKEVQNLYNLNHKTSFKLLQKTITTQHN